MAGLVRRHHRLVQRLGSGLLIVVGHLSLTGLWKALTRWLQTEARFRVPKRRSDAMLAQGKIGVYYLIMRSDDTVIGLDGCSVRCVHAEKVQLVLDASLPMDDLSRAAAMFKLLGDPTRARLLFALLEAGELCVCDLAAATGTQEATVSQSLRLLRASGVVTGRRQGRLVFYRLADAHVRMLLDVTRVHIAHDVDGARDYATVPAETRS